MKKPREAGTSALFFASSNSTRDIAVEALLRAAYNTPTGALVAIISAL